MATDPERIATLEARHESHQEDIQVLREDVASIKTDVKAIRSKLDKQGGFVGGIVMSVTLVWSLIVAGVMSMWDKIK